MRPRWPRLLILVILSILLAGVASGDQTGNQSEPPIDTGPVEVPEGCTGLPGEVTGLLMSAPSTLGWDVEPCSPRYNVYRAALGDLRAGQPSRCHASHLLATTLATPQDPGPAEGFAYLVTGEATSESTPGFASGGAERALAGSCNDAIRSHVFNRAGFGWDQWSRDRLASLGPVAYLDEQLTPALIDEGTNLLLNNALAVLEPPETVQELLGGALVRAVYGRRQLEQAATIFWTNHFNTDYNKSFPFFFVYNPDTVRKRLEATTLHYRESEDFRRLAFSGNFRQILDASAYSSAMIIYLDTKDSLAGNPNENYARELLELHTMGVDGGYDDFDIVELARVFTGWNVCKKETPFVDDPLAACVGTDLIGGPSEPQGLWVANFRSNFHDCGSKVLFQGTPQQTLIPDTCGNPSDGINDAQIALDAIATHPSTLRFISKKLLEKFITETPSESMIDEIVAAWETSGNPAGIGDLQALLGAVLAESRFLDPDIFRNKVKTPFEHMASAFRAVQGRTNGTSQVRGYLQRMDHLPFENPVPTGYPEDGSSWIDTNNMLERHNFGEDMSDSGSTSFGADLISLLVANGVSNAPGNAAAIVDFFGDTMFGRAISPVERQAAIDFLETDDSGDPSPNYNNTRIRQTVGYMLGYAQFQEQ